MRIAIDKAGRLVLPKAARDRLGLKAGDVLEVQPTAEGLHLTPVHESPQLVKEGNVLVFNGGVLNRDAEELIQEQRDARLNELVRQALS
jgi:AbrB family looped-hinge helix DNA binding protein